MYNGNWEVISGEEYFDQGKISFPNTHCAKPDRTYRSHFGPCFDHDGRILADNNWNFSQAFQLRLAAKRKPEIPGYHEWLFRNQERFFNEHSAHFKRLCQLYTPTFESYTNAYLEAQLHHAEPHPKKELRIAGFAEMLQTREDANKGWCKTPIIKFKKDEIAKAGGKPGRVIVNLGIIASLLGFRLTDYLKKAMAANTFVYEGITFEFCKSPKQLDLDRIFRNLIEPPGRGYFVYFSDDSCFATRHNGKVYRYNVDISKCDASHGPDVFDALSAITPMKARRDMDNLITQCSKPCKIFDRNSKRKIILKPRRKVLYSGTTITTNINNLANIAIGFALAEDRAYLPEHIASSAERAGYIVTVEDATEDWYLLQFLKHSPLLDINQDIRAVLNIGVLLRASGVCRGDLPGRGEITERARCFQHQLLCGAYPRTFCPFIDALRRPRGGDSLSTKSQELIAEAISRKFEHKVVDDEDEPPVHCTDEQLFRRYNLQPHERAEMLDIATKADVELHYSSPATDKIYQADYGLHALNGFLNWDLSYQEFNANPLLPTAHFRRR